MSTLLGRVLGGTGSPLAVAQRERAKQPEIGKLIDNAMDLIEVDNPSLRCMVPKTYARPSLDVRRIGTGTTVTYTLSQPLVVDLLTVTRSRLQEVINDRLESLTELQTDFADQ
jgi:hypothetical protein